MKKEVSGQHRESGALRGVAGKKAKHISTTELIVAVFLGKKRAQKQNMLSRLSFYFINQHLKLAVSVVLAK